MKKINHITSKKFVIYACKNLVPTKAMKLHLKNITKFKTIVITLANKEVRLMIFVT